MPLSRRRLLAGAAGLAAAFGAGSRVARAERPGRLRCLPIISGALRPYDAAFSRREGIDGWRRELDDERRIGFDLLWLSHFQPALAEPGPADPLGNLLDLCARRKVQVILDTGSSGDWYSRLDLDHELRLVGGYIRTIAERYGRHPAFYAWYVPHEIYVAWGRFGQYVDRLYPSLVELCKRAADKPVTVSPFFILDRDRIFGDFRYATPAEYERYWSRLLRASGFDLVLLQDSGEHFSYVTDAQRRPFFAAMRAACDAGGARLWGNVETAEFDCPSPEEYVRRYGRVHHSTVPDAPWRAVPLDRLESKLRLAAEYSERIVSWGYYQYGRPDLSPEAAAWYRQYRNYYRRVIGGETSAA